MIDRLRASVALAATCAMLGCARVVAPAGGPPDTVPPVLLRAAPDSGAVGVSREGTLRLEFSEWIDPATARTAISLMPAPSRAPRIDVDGKTVVVSLREPLDSAATSILRVGEGVADFRGASGSPVREIPFSTGPALDSLELRVQVWSGGDSLGIARAQARVGIWALDSSRRAGLSRLLRRRDSLDWLRSPPAPWREKAWRWAATDSQGVARFEHLPPGRWRVLAWVDGDKDGFWRPGDESIGWAGDLDWSTGGTRRWMFARTAALDTTGPTPAAADTSRASDSARAARDSTLRRDSLRLDSLAARDSSLDADSTRILELDAIPRSFLGSKSLKFRLVRLDARRRPRVVAVPTAGLRLRVPRGGRWSGELWLDLDGDGRASVGDPFRMLPAEPWRPVEPFQDPDTSTDPVLRIVPVELPETTGATP